MQKLTTALQNTRSKVPVQSAAQHRPAHRPRALFLGKEREYFIENFNLLLSSGIPVLETLEIIGSEARSRRMRRIIADIASDIEAGQPLWKALYTAQLFPNHGIALIRLGEQSGRLVQNLAVVGVEQEKNRLFKEKLRSAMLYPLFVLVLTLVIGIGISWFVLPKLALVFTQLKLDLPLVTRMLIYAGTFLNERGAYAIPLLFAALACVLYFVFVFSKTNFIGQSILFALPGIKKLIKEVELSRLGYLLGTLLEAGLPATRSLEALVSATEFRRYGKLYEHLQAAVEEGNSLQKGFALYPKAGRLVPLPVQQLLFAGERSGSLAKTLLKIGSTFEARADATTKNLTVILEPILLIVVWLGVVGVALAIILPIYNLIGGLNQ